jgi:hypothetical protein
MQALRIALAINVKLLHMRLDLQRTEGAVVNLINQFVPSTI